jgi:hypothetical protein
MIMDNDSQMKNNSQIKPFMSYINPNKNNMILEKMMSQRTAINLVKHNNLI